MNNAEPNIKNVFVLMLENHSFDNIFAMSGIQGINAATVQNSNSYQGEKYLVQDHAPLFMTTDPGHEFKDVLEQLCGADAACKYKGGAYPSVNNSGFASSYATSLSEDTGTPAPAHIGDIMACFDTSKQLPVIHQLACEFAICDNWYSSLPGPTWPNRFFVHGASSAGWTDSPHLRDEVTWELIKGFRYSNGSIFEALRNAGYSWRLYNDDKNQFSDDPSGPEYGGWISQVASLHGISQLDLHSIDHFASDLNKITEGVPAYTYTYTFIEPNFGRSFFSPQECHKGPTYKGPTYKGGSSQHPEDDPSGGEGLIKAVYEAIRNSPVWNTSLLVIVYDEHGGFYDHVKPGCATPPDDGIPEGQVTRNALGFDFRQYGVRVPAVIVSPLIARGTVDHTLYDHSSILATLERLLGMNPLTRRDESAKDFRHLLTNPAPREDCPKTLVQPATASPHRGMFEKGLAALDHLVEEVAGKAETVIDEVLGHVTTVHDEPLPDSGNIIGFLQILLKTELECSQLNGEDEAEKARILENYKKIDTKNKAQAYVKYIKDKIEATKRSEITGERV